MNKSLLTHLGEAVDAYRVQRRERQPEQAAASQRRPGWRGWLPSKGNVLFTLLLVGLLVVAQSVGALPQSLIPAPQSPPSTGTIAYQGRLADADGNPLTDTVPMIFRLYDAVSGGAPLWEEQWTGSSSVQVSDGLFNVMLGSLTPIPASLITSNSSLFLGITVGTDDEMAPRVQLGSVPFAVQALTVPDGSVTTGKLADGAVDSSKLADDLNVSGNLSVQSSLSIGTNVPNTNQVVIQHALGSDDIVASQHDWQLELRNGLGSYGTKSMALGLLDGGKGVVQVKEANVGYGPLVLNPNGGGVGIGLKTPGTLLDVGGEIRTVNANDPSATWDNVMLWAENTRSFIQSEDNGLWISSRGEYVHIDDRLDVLGDLNVYGAKSAVVNTNSYGSRTLYAVESPESRFSDEGLAKLNSGQAEVAIDPIFLQTIERDFLVQVTPYGNASLYVAEIGEGYFVVKAQQGDPDVAFAWRLSATRRGYAGVRLEEVK